MAKMLWEQRDGSYKMEMTQDDWNKIHKDFKSEPGEPTSCMALIPDKGSCIVPVTLLTSVDQDLNRTMAKPFDNPHNMNKLKKNQIVTITEQTASHVYVRDEQGNTFTLPLDAFNERRERWAFTSEELQSGELDFNGNDEFLCTCPYDDGDEKDKEFFATWKERGIIVHRNGTVSNRYGDGTKGPDAIEIDMIENGEPALYKIVDGKPTVEADTWRTVLADKDGGFVRFINY